MLQSVIIHRKPQAVSLQCNMLCNAAELAVIADLWG